MKAKAIAIVAVAAVAALALAGYAWYSGQQKAAIAQEAVPEVPDLNDFAPELTERVKEAHDQAVHGPDPVEGLAELSRLYHANGFLAEAWQCYIGLVEVEPSNPVWPYRFASILAGYGHLEEATPLYQRSLSLDPDYMPTRIRLGDTLLKQNRIEEAEAAYEGALRIESDNPYALVGLGRVAIAREDWAQARVHLEKAITASSFQIGADLLGDVYEKLGLNSKEQIVLKNIIWGSYADIPDPRMLTLMDDSYDAYQVSIAGGWVVHQGDLRKGLRYIARAVELDPTDFMLHHQAGGIYKQLHQMDEAKQHFQRAVELQPDFADAWIELILIAEAERSPTTARRLLEKAYAHNPNSPSLNIRKGQALLDQRRPGEAIPFFQRAAELRPHEAGAYIKLAQAYMAQERIAEAMDQMREALKVEPSNPIALTTLLLNAIVEGDRSRADEWFKRLSIQPRITEQEVQALAQRYQQQFGVPPSL